MIIKNELVGYNVINYLLSEFICAVLDKEPNPKKKKRSKNGKIYSLISSNYEFIFNHYSEKSIYNKIQLAIDYVTGMTDSFALSLYKELNGHMN
jgi:dGTPase